MNDFIDKCDEMRKILQRRAEELRLQELIKDLDARRVDWERRSALFIPSKMRLERGGKALELGEDYKAIKELRFSQGQNKIRQTSLRDEMTEIRTALHNSEEALTICEAEYRDKLAEQTKLNNVIQKVKMLDEQVADLQREAINAREDYEASEQTLKEYTARAESEQFALEKIEIALREARKFLQLHSIDEKLITGLTGIQKCFNMYEQAEAKGIALKNSWGEAIQKKQQAQSVLNDRAALFSEVTHRYETIERDYARARAFFESTLKGKTISEWHEICEKNITRISELEELYKKFQEAESLETQQKTFHESRLRMQQEARSLSMKDIEQAAKIQELQTEAAKLERRVTLLHKIEDLDAVRELLQDGIPCPLCGASAHPYATGSLVPDPEEIHGQLRAAQKELDELHAELETRQTRAGKISQEITTLGQNETEIREKLSAVNAEISAKVSQLGIKLGASVSPFEEIDHEKQKARDTLQIARNAASTSEAAERDMKAKYDELEKIRATREEITKLHQDALFALQKEKSEESQLSGESKTQDEIINSLKRELVAQIMPFGYKVLPDKNPEEVITTLEQRLTAWQEGVKRSDELERELSSAVAKLNNSRAARESQKLKRDELSSRVKAFEAERDSVQQQRIVIFASKRPEDESARMSADVENLRSIMNERREAKNKKSDELDQIMMKIHALETEMATGREDLQRHEINFNKKLLALGFKNEDDYSTALLTPEERRDLQNKLRELTQTDLELQAERENTRAKILELQSEDDGGDLAKKFAEFRSSFNALDNHEGLNEILAEINSLALTCGLAEV